MERVKNCNDTRLIPKTGKPTAKDHRPIVLKNVGYKIFMGLVKSKLVEHLERNRLISDYQAGYQFIDTPL